ncbi:hypothetical protein NLJ89_g10618 [Agrocybe chaxingu]|uniref:chitin synthase n=1 Tax=Agrocybe chaxingu TaxID=84603 RepID=A0A9W8MNR7_9AGAR|nr:hypothetical protein NLJ89_g10618 [Agrocybe chaxingu]
MASRRKAVPRESRTNETTQLHEPADPQIARYSLSDTPTTYESFNSSTDYLVQQNQTNSRSTSQTDPFQEVASSVHGHSASVPSSDHSSAGGYTPYQPGQYLAPIMTGETLQLVSETAPSSSTHSDPFYDPSAPLSSLPTPLAAVEPAGHPYDNDQPYHVPPHADQSYLSTYDHELPAGEVDHFRHDTEAYASGNYSRASHRPPRSRSPTPAVDDEDYYVVNNKSFHHTGQPEHRYSYDPEKGALGHEYAAKETSYYSERGYLPNGQAVVFDPEPETPTSTLYSLPPETPLETRHFGPAPTGRILRRNKTKRKVQLTNGNLVVDLDVPPKLVLPRRGEPETMKTRYTAVTCDPDDFEKKGFFLRQNERGRRTELFIVITMYNEDEILFFCIVADGRKKVHPRVLDCLTLLGVYQPGDHMKNKVNEKEVTAHLFEYTTSFALDPNLHFKYPDKGIVPTQIIFCMKEKNQKKINSHRWFFNAFAPMLQPNVCVLLDVGTRPGNNSIYRLWKAFDVNSSVAGACGEIAVYKGKNWSLLLNPLVAAQNFEYKISSILDKPTESMFGYISVLPGAFSAYRYIALQNGENGVGPLASYFKGEVLHGRDTDIFTSNMYLAEDRILCFELIAKANSSWILKYVKGAIGETDVPDALPEFISQRRRWLNGSFFAATYAIAHVGQVMRSGHSFARKVTFVVETVYNIINLVFAWFSIGNFYLFFAVLTTSLEDPSFGLKGINYFNSLVQYIMGSLIVACFLFSMGNKPASSKMKYKLTSIIMSVLMLYMIAASIKCALEAANQGGAANSVMLFSILVTYGLWAFSSLLALDPWHLFTSFIPYMLLSPMYINVLNIYAFSNLDDISWGTKQDYMPESDLGAVIQDSQSHVDVEMLTEAADVNSIYEESLANLRDRVPVDNGKGKTPRSIAEREAAAKSYYANVRTNVLLAWVLSNGVLLVGILGGMKEMDAFGRDVGMTRVKVYLVFILAFTAITNSVRFVGSTLYLLARLITG